MDDRSGPVETPDREPSDTSEREPIPIPPHTMPTMFVGEDKEEFDKQQRIAWTGGVVPIDGDGPDVSGAELADLTKQQAEAEARAPKPPEASRIIIPDSVLERNKPSEAQLAAEKQEAEQMRVTTLLHSTDLEIHNIIIGGQQYVVYMNMTAENYGQMVVIEIVRKLKAELPDPQGKLGEREVQWSRKMDLTEKEWNWPEDYLKAIEVADDGEVEGEKIVRGMIADQVKEIKAARKKAFRDHQLQVKPFTAQGIVDQQTSRRVSRDQFRSDNPKEGRPRIKNH